MKVYSQSARAIRYRQEMGVGEFANERCTHSGVGTTCCPNPKCQHRYELPPATRGISQGFCIFCNRENRFRADNKETIFYYLKRERLYPDVVKSVLHIVTTKLLERGLSFSDEEESWIAWPTLATLVGSQPPIKTDQALTILRNFSRCLRESRFKTV